MSIRVRRRYSERGASARSVARPSRPADTAENNPNGVERPIMRATYFTSERSTRCPAADSGAVCHASSASNRLGEAT